MSTKTDTPSHERLMELAELLGIGIPPVEDDPRSCSHAWGFVLNPDLVDDWFLEALHDVRVTAPEVPGVANAFRVDGYVDWPALLAAHPDQLGTEEDWTPTAFSLELVEQLRAAGHAASLTGYIDVVGQMDDHRLVYGLVASDIRVDGDNAAAILKPHEGALRGALEEVPEEGRAGLMLYDDGCCAFWAFG